MAVELYNEAQNRYELVARWGEFPAEEGHRCDGIEITVNITFLNDIT